jgi:myo-inositol 2-dehydrogenase / D-chiro-inositol 1-dehydrogenase
MPTRDTYSTTPDHRPDTLAAMSHLLVTRRNFLRATAVTAAAAPWIVSARVWGRDAPSNTLRLGCIGTGRMGLVNLQECLTRGLDPSGRAHIVAVCDVDRRRAAHAQQSAERQYADRLPSAPRIEMYSDYRELLARDDLDGVIVATPDHWHGLVAIAAARAGKDIYLQKPLTYSVGEGRKLREAVRSKEVILQVGSQQRSSAVFRRACELVLNRRIGRLQTIIIRLPVDTGTGNARPMAVPKHLDYDRWLGPAPQAAYTQDRVHPQQGYERPGWLQIEAYSRGMITGWGSHMFDIAQWGHGSDNSGLVEIEASAEFPERGLFDVHTTFRARGRYADGVEVIAQSGEPAAVKFVGDEGWIEVGRSRLVAEPREMLDEPLGNGEQRLMRSDDHMRNFLQSMRSRRDPICPVEVGHRSNTLCVITHIAMKLGRKLRWDPAGEQFIDDEIANSLLNDSYRAPWNDA